jgi:hypothetical protein
MANHCKLGSGTIHRLFSEPTLPKPKPLLDVVEFLAKQCYKVDPDTECDRFDWLYRRALDEWIPNPFPSDDERDDEDPGHFPGLGAVPPPPKPVGPAGGALAPAAPAEIGPPVQGRPAGEAGRDVPDRNGTTRALLVGSRCDDVKCPQCDGFSGGLEQFRRSLTGFFPDGTTVISNGSREEIWKALVHESVTTDGTLLIYFCGHGIRDERTSDVVLMAADTAITKDGFVTNTIALRDVRQLLAASSSADVVFLLDVNFMDDRIEDADALTVLPTPTETGDILVHSSVMTNGTPRAALVVGNNVDHGGSLRGAILTELATGTTRLDAAITQAAADVNNAALQLNDGGDKLTLPAAAEYAPDQRAPAILALATVGDFIASALDDGTVQMWNPATGALQGALPGNGHALIGLTGSSDGRAVCGVRANGEIFVVDFGDSNPTDIRLGFIAVAETTGGVGLWDVSDGSRHRVDVTLGSVRAAGVTPNGRWLATVGDDNALHLRDLTDERSMPRSAVPNAMVTALAVKPDGTQVAATTTDGYVHVVNSHTGATDAVFYIGFRAQACTWAQDGLRLAVVGDHTPIHLLDV